jgi:hypothetical protein
MTRPFIVSLWMGVEDGSWSKVGTLNSLTNTVA